MPIGFLCNSWLHPRVIYIGRTIPARVSIWVLFPPPPRRTERFHKVYMLRVPFLPPKFDCANI